MKKLFTLFIALLALLCNHIYAQPVLTASGSNPSTADSFTNAVANYVSPGSSGANQTWDLSSMSATEMFTLTYADPATTPYGSDFPNANLAELSTPPYDQISYYNVSSSGFQFTGAVLGGVVLSYSDPEDILRFPLTYDDSFVDSWEVQFVSAGNTFYRTGLTTATVDGYGTLITPDTTFTNVLRVHYVQEYQDSTEMQGSPFLITYNCEMYLWFTEGIPHKLARVHTLSSSTGHYESQGIYLSHFVTAIKEDTEKLNWKVYPNPVTDKVTLELPGKAGQNVEINLYNALGERVKTRIQAQNINGDNRMEMDVSALSEGLYVLKMTVNGKIIQTKRIVKM